MKTEIGEMPDDFIAKVTRVNKTKYIHIPIRVSESGDYEEGDVIKVWIKKVVKK